MKMIDLTHPIVPGLVTYPGCPAAEINVYQTLDQDGWQATSLTLDSHQGTHIDAPSHLIVAGASLDQLPLSHFFGLALLLDVSAFAGKAIPAEALRAAEEQLGTCEFLVLHTGWAKKWGTPAYFEAYPVLSKDAAEYLASFETILGVGTDTASLDPVDAPDFPAHQALLGAGKILIENLCALDTIWGEHFLLSVLPLSYAQADASPVRAVGFQAPAGIYYPGLAGP